MIGKNILKLTALMFVLLLATGCFSDSKTKTVTATNIAVSEATGTGTNTDPYKLSVVNGQEVTVDVTVTPTDADTLEVTYEVVKKDGSNFVALASTDTPGISVASTSTNTKLTVEGLTVGTHYVKVTSKSDESVNAIVEVTVYKATIPVTGINFPILTGDGTVTAPFVVSIAYTQTKDLSFVVAPNNAADKSITWSLVKKVDDAFVALESADTAVIEITNESTIRLSVKAIASEGVGYIKGTANDDSGVVIIIQVNIEAFTPVTSITSDQLMVGDTTDFKFVTAVGSQWDMSNEQLARKDGLIAGTAGPGGGQAAADMTYWPSLYNLGLSVMPEEASDGTLLFEYSVPGIVTLNADGTWEAVSAGTTIVTISSYTNPDVDTTIEFTVEDSLYPGILQSAWDATTVSSLSVWNFDDNPDNLRTRPLLLEWQLVQMQTNSLRGEDNSDGNQKMFYLGSSDRVYGIALESRVNEGKGSLSDTTALVWNKVAITSDATTMDLAIGNNDKVHNQYRVVMVTDNGTVYTLQDWTALTEPNSSGRVNGLVIPDEVKGQTVAVAIEQRLTEKENNAELHIKGIWINQYAPVSDITLDASTGTVGQGGTVQLNPVIAPTNATNKAVIYEVSPAQSGVTVSANGLITVAIDATVQDYVVTVRSVDNNAVSKTYTLTVEENNPTTSFELVGIQDGESLTATYHIGTPNYSDVPLQLRFLFNDGASDQTWTATLVGDSVSVSSSGLITYLQAGTTVVTITPTANPALAVSFTIVVEEYTASSQIVEGVYINTTEAHNRDASILTRWLTQELVRSEWLAENVTKDHGGSKVADYGDTSGKIMLEGHATSANFMQPINIIWNKVAIANDTNSFMFQVRSHDDDRVLESTNFRVRVVTLGSTATVDTLLDWTTVAGRWKQDQEWFEVNLDVSAYQGQEVILMIEQTGSVQNNGDWPKYSDSGAGAYLHIQGFELSTEVATDDNVDMRVAFNVNNTLPTGWNLENNPYGENVYVDGVLQPFALVYNDTLSSNGLMLSTTNIFLANSSGDTPMFYMWGLYPALNNDDEGNTVSYSLLNPDNGVVTLVNNELMAIGTGETTLIVSYNAFGSTTETVDLMVTIRVE